MTINDLYKYQTIKLEISQLELELQELENAGVKSRGYSIVPTAPSMPNSPTEKVFLQIEKLHKKILYKQSQLVKELDKIEEFLSTVEDDDIRIIIRLRFIKGWTWNDVGRELHMDRSTPYYRLKKYLERKSK